MFFSKFVETTGASMLYEAILGLEDSALSCDNKDVALATVRLLREAWKELNG